MTSSWEHWLGHARAGRDAYWANITPEQRADRNRKSAETRARNQKIYAEMRAAAAQEEARRSRRREQQRIRRNGGSARPSSAQRQDPVALSTAGIRCPGSTYSDVASASGPTSTSRQGTSLVGPGMAPSASTAVRASALAWSAHPGASGGVDRSPADLTSRTTWLWITAVAALGARTLITLNPSPGRRTIAVATSARPKQPGCARRSTVPSRTGGIPSGDGSTTKPATGYLTSRAARWTVSAPDSGRFLLAGAWHPPRHSSASRTRFAS